MQIGAILGESGVMIPWESVEPLGSERGVVGVSQESFLWFGSMLNIEQRVCKESMNNPQGKGIF